MRRFKMKKDRLDRGLLEAILDKDKIHALYPKGEALPFLYRWQVFFISSAVFISIGLSYLFFDPVSNNSIWTVIMFLYSCLVFSVIMLAPYFYFVSRPIIKRMKRQYFDTSNLLFFPLHSVELYQEWLAVIYDHCIFKGFFSGSYQDIEKINEYIDCMKELLNGKAYRERFRIFGIPQMAAIFFLLLGALLNSFLPAQLYTEMSFSDLINKLLPCFLLFILSIGLLLVWELCLRGYDLFVNRDHSRMMRACDILNNIKLNLIYDVGDLSIKDSQASSTEGDIIIEARNDCDREEVKVEFICSEDNKEVVS